MSELIKVISDDACACGDDQNVNLQPSVNPVDQIVVRNKPGIFNGNKINTFQENGKKIYELDDYTLEAPRVALTNNGGVAEVGQTLASVTFNGSILAATNPIVSRSITPDPGGLDLTSPFSFVKTNVKRTSVGRAEEHTLLATDNEDFYYSVKNWIPFKNAIYQGFNSLAVLDQTAIKALANKSLKDAVIQQYGGEKNYIVPASPAGPKYIYWAGPASTPIPTGAILNGLPLPLDYSHSLINVTNIHDGSISVSYWVLRTANRIDVGSYAITLLGASVVDEGDNTQNSNIPVAQNGGVINQILISEVPTLFDDFFGGDNTSDYISTLRWRKYQVSAVSFSAIFQSYGAIQIFIDGLTEGYVALPGVQISYSQFKNFEVKVQCQSFSTPTSFFIGLGAVYTGVNASGYVNCIGFIVENGGNWKAIVGDGEIRRVTTTVPFSDPGVWHVLRVEKTSIGLDYFIDGALVAQHITNETILTPKMENYFAGGSYVVGVDYFKANFIDR